MRMWIRMKWFITFDKSDASSGWAANLRSMRWTWICVPCVASCVMKVIWIIYSACYWIFLLIIYSWFWNCVNGFRFYLILVLVFVSALSRSGWKTGFTVFSSSSSSSSSSLVQIFIVCRFIESMVRLTSFEDSVFNRI